MKHLFAFVAAVVVASVSFAQSPQWKSGYFKELENTYLETASGTAKTIGEARDKAASEIVRKRDLATGASAKVVNGQVTTSGSLKVKSRIVDEYVERNSQGEYTVYILAQTAKHPGNPYEQVSVTDEYPFSARCFVPGMQQLYKGQKVKGIAFIGAEVLAVGGIIVSESMRADYSGKAAVERNASRKTALVDNANTMQNVRNICIGAAAAVYIWNVVDAIVSKGGKRVVLADASLVPYASPDGFGLAFNYRF
jgi:hypothetical protein